MKKAKFKKLIFIGYTCPDEKDNKEKMFGIYKEVNEICNKCESYKDCDWENEDCTIKYLEVCNQNKKILYESEVRGLF